jgi:hypothetical protein
LEDSVTDIAVGATAAAAAAVAAAAVAAAAVAAAASASAVVRADWLLGFVGFASCVSFSFPIFPSPVSAPIGCGLFLGSVRCCGGGEVGRRCAGDTTTAGFAAGVFC